MNSDRVLKRNYGIDALRLLSMFMIVTRHILYHGGVISKCAGGQFIIVSLLNSIVLCAVDCYAIISGYVGFSSYKEGKTRYYKIFILWLQVFLYSFALTGIVQLCTGNIDIKTMIKAMLPVTTGQYWYFACYVGVFFVTPWINKFIFNISRKEAKQCLLMMMLFVFYTSFAAILHDPFRIMGGYSFVWLMILYVLGGLLKKLNIVEQTTSGRIIFVACVCVLLSWSNQLLIPTFNVLTSYTSPTMVGLAICLVLFFAKVKVNETIEKYINILAPAAFGVYLIHDNNAIRNVMIKNQFAWLIEYPISVFVILIFGCSLLIFTVALLIDLLRSRLFKLLRISEYCIKIERDILGLINSMKVFLNKKCRNKTL